jgi:hypothetical protein
MKSAGTGMWLSGMTDTYKCFGCDNEFEFPARAMLRENKGYQTNGYFVCDMCYDKLVMRKGSL